MSRQEELKCLEKVKCGISEEYYLNKQIRSHSFGQRMECNYYCKESGRIAEALINAKENPNENDFPDFIVGVDSLSILRCQRRKKTDTVLNIGKKRVKSIENGKANLKMKKRNFSNQFILQIR